MKNLIIISFLFLLCGCSTTYRQQRDIKKLDGLALQQPNEFARLANLLEPCFSGKAKSDTVITSRTDTLVKDGVTAVVKVKDTVYITKTLPGKVITNTKTIAIRDTVEDQRKSRVIGNDLKIKSDSLIVVRHDLLTSNKSCNKWMWISIGLISLIAVFVIAKVVIFFYSGGISGVIK